MPALRRVVAVLLLSLWLPATLHCDLEAAGLDLALLCHEHAEAVDLAAPCADETCHAVESTDYTAFALTKLIDAPVLTLIALLPPPRELPVTAAVLARIAAPPELPRRWQFAHRAALPPRAP